jgi:transcriptional regulator with XRE-family HTH domain
MTTHTTGLGSRLKDGRKQLGISRRALAIDLGVSPETLRKIENGTTKSPRAKLLHDLARKLDIDLDYLISGQESGETLLDNLRPTIHQTQDSILEVSLPCQVVLDDQEREELASRLAVEFEILRKRREAVRAHDFQP